MASSDAGRRTLTKQAEAGFLLVVYSHTDRESHSNAGAGAGAGRIEGARSWRALLYSVSGHRCLNHGVAFRTGP